MFSLLAGLVLAAGFTQTFAQTSAPVSGKVVVEKDGKREPVAGALVEVYRTDINTGSPSAKTNKKGEFYLAGLMLGGEFAFAVSAPDMAATVYPGVKAGRENIVIIMTPGDGRKLTEAEARAAFAQVSGPANASSGPTEAEKKAAADIEKRNAEIMASNKKIQEGDAISRKANDEGNVALKAADYDLAIAKFGEGITAVPDYVGSTPVLLGGRINALKGKAYKIYREGASSQDIALRKTKYEEANRLFDQALADFQNGIDIIQKAAPSDANEMNRRTLLRGDLYAAATDIHRLKAVALVDSSKIADAKTVITEYIALQQDPAKKLTGKMVLGDVMKAAGDFEQAIAAYRDVLVDNPEHPEAMANLGLSLVAFGASQSPENKEKMQEGLNYMQKYTEIAPVASTDPPAVKELKESVKATVDYLKAEKMVPQKVATPKATPRKRG
jgi:tetratricopeptide (TPR) repeat protein